MTDGPIRVIRHGRRARWLHGLNALALTILIPTGLAMGERLPATWVHDLGGHAFLATAHQHLGLVLTVALLLAVLIWFGKTIKLLQELTHYPLRDLTWPGRFLRHLLQPARYPAPDHAARLDPGQRLVIAGLLLTLVLASASGVWLWFSPEAPRWVFAAVVRTHIYSTWTLLGMLGLHILAGLGLLPTHRGIWRSMFGNGSVPLATARRLWPGWTSRQLDSTQSSGKNSPR